MPRRSRTVPAARSRSVLLALAVLVTSTNLRAALTSVGPAVDEIQAALGLSATVVSLLTALPLVLFGVGAFSFPALARRTSPDRLAVVLLVLVAVGLLLRSSAGVTALLIGTIGAGAGIAVLNVLLPAIIKEEFPHRVGMMMGLYVGAMSAVAGIAAWATVPITVRGPDGWRWGLAVWAAPALLGLLAWGAFGVRHRVARFPAPDTPPRELRHDGVAWAVTIYMGLQALIFYTLVAWLPSVLRAAGVSPARAGLALSLLLLVGVPVSLFVPSMASRSVTQVPLAHASAAAVLLGVVALIVAPARAPDLWAVLLGVGTASGFSLALTLAVLRTRTSHDTARLSAMSQGVGYLLAVLGPALLGAMIDLTGSWTPPLLALACFVALQAWVGGRAGLPRTVSDTTATRHSDDLP